MYNLKFVQATEKDILLIENLLLKKVHDLKQRGLIQWSEKEVLWKTLSKSFVPDDFYLVYQNETLIACFAVADEDPLFWPDVRKGKSLFIHKLTVDDSMKGAGIADQILTFFKELGNMLNLSDVRLDVRADKDKLIKLYERNGFFKVGEISVLSDTNSYLYQYDLKNSSI